MLVGRVQPNANLQPEGCVLWRHVMFTKIREEGLEKFGDVSNDMSLKEDNRKRLIERGVNSEIGKTLLGCAGDR